jgi:hypothetical protein
MKNARADGLRLVLGRTRGHGPISGHLALVDRRVEVGDLRYPQVPEALAGGLDGFLIASSQEVLLVPTRSVTHVDWT